MPKTARPPMLQFETLDAMIATAMDQAASDAQAAAELIVAWLETHDALADAFGARLWRLGALALCRNSTVKTRSRATEAARGPLPVRVPGNGGASPVPSVLPMKRPATSLQRPTGLAHVGRARTLADEDRLMHFPLGHGLPLHRATKGAILDYAHDKDTQIATMVLRRTWLLLVATAMPNTEVTVGEVLDEQQLRCLYTQAEAQPNT